MFKKTIACIAVVLLGMAPIASAEVVYNAFYADMDASTNTVTDWGTTGGDPMYGDTFYEYPQPAGPTWSNAWFFNSPDIEGWKWIEYLIVLEPQGQVEIEVAINWSDRQWTDTSRPPTDPAEDPSIVRQTIFSGPSLDVLTLDNRDDPLIIPDFNPIWVSYDVRILEFIGGDPVIYGDVQLWHEHVPEPTTMSLLALGGLALLRRKRQK